MSKGTMGISSDACCVLGGVEGGCLPQRWEAQAGGDFFLEGGSARE